MSPAFLRYFFTLLSLFLVPWIALASDECRQSTEAWESMSHGTVRLKTSSGDLIEVPIRAADNKLEILGGYQWLCTNVVEDSAILFIFKRPLAGKFHMKNVYTSLDTFFFDSKGQVLKIEHMRPEPNGAITNSQMYGPDEAFSFVLEIPVSRFSQKLSALDQLVLWDFNITSEP